MTGITLADAQANLAAAQAAYRAALSARSVASSDRTLQRQEIDQLLAQINHWQRECDRLSPTPAHRVHTLVVHG